jgi:hypothetical protein
MPIRTFTVVTLLRSGDYRQCLVALPTAGALPEGSAQNSAVETADEQGHLPPPPRRPTVISRGVAVLVLAAIPWLLTCLVFAVAVVVSGGSAGPAVGMVLISLVILSYVRLVLDVRNGHARARVVVTVLTVGFCGLGLLSPYLVVETMILMLATAVISAAGLILIWQPASSRYVAEVTVIRKQVLGRRGNS